ncbi:MFS transporter [Gracilibacillus oryzae]|uniref:MFS transporter n=1 Tax=Gracilibacillus oryzae TaxID=1672701 RepID=A0A7C8GUK8_9BACI|nr:MFS transporter [Gracilibacillus oryzae]KAB8138076.1 MFS transporter [Gracilibacillus oryzae]
MNWKEKKTIWKYRFILLFGIGISNIGEWVYFIALNLIVLDMTGSPLAVSGLYIMKPLAALFTNFWAGSLVDRINKRKLMIFLDMVRAVLIMLLPAFPSILFIYLIVFMINMASALFEPASISYLTKLIPEKDRKQFNSLHSVLTSGAFLLGPAIAGFLFLIGTPVIAIYVNVLALFISGTITCFMPNVETKNNTIPFEKVSIALLRKDWEVVVQYSSKNRYVLIVYGLFSFVMVVMASAVDSLEAAFAKEVLLLKDSEYGLLVSIAGAGILSGAVLNSIIVKHVPITWLIGLGTMFVSSGYVIYAISETLFMAGSGFFILAFFLSFSNTGFLTFYQNNIPTEMIGRVGSIYGLMEAFITIIATGLMGIATQFISIQMTVMIGVIFMVLFSVMLLIISFYPSGKHYMETVKTIQH